MDENMSEPVGDRSLIDRVERLERILRMMRVTLVLIVLLVVFAAFAVVVKPAKAEDNKKAEMYRVGGIVLVDKNGQSRGTWTVLEKGDVMLTMNDANEKPRLVMLVDKAGHSEVTMLGDTGEPRGSWVAATNGQTEFSLSDTNGKPRFGAKVEANGAYWQLNDDDGKTRVMCSALTIAGLKKAEIGLYDRAAKRRLAMFTVTDGTPVIVFPDDTSAMAVVGGWFVKDGQLMQMSKGNIPNALMGK